METLDGSEFTLTMLATLAQEESTNMSKRVKFGKAQNALKGKVPNQCYGYIKTIGDYFHLQINETEADIVREIFDLYVNQGEGALIISKRLNARGLTSARGVPWSTTAVSRLLKNKLYAGYVVNGKSEITDFIEKTRRTKDETEWVEVERPELRIIPLELWEKAQSVNAANNLGLKKTVHKKAQQLPSVQHTDHLSGLWAFVLAFQDRAQKLYKNLVSISASSSLLPI